MQGKDHPIVPVMLEDARLATEFADEMLERGIYVIGFSFPVVPKGAYTLLQLRIPLGEHLFPSEFFFFYYSAFLLLFLQERLAFECSCLPLTVRRRWTGAWRLSLILGDEGTLFCRLLFKT